MLATMALALSWPYPPPPTNTAGTDKACSRSSTNWSLATQSSIVIEPAVAE